MDKILADDSDAVALGRFTQKINATGRVFSSEFAIHVIVEGGKITRYRIHEDTFAVAEGVAA